VFLVSFEANGIAGKVGTVQPAGCSGRDRKKVRAAVKKWVKLSSGNHLLIRAGHEWLLAGLSGALVIGCVSESGRNAICELTNLRSNEALKPPDRVRREGFLVMGTVTRRQPGTERPETFVSAWNEFETHQQLIQRHSVNSKY
jgi:hypothetical protein